jgi:hypothetical protein
VSPEETREFIIDPMITKQAVILVPLGSPPSAAREQLFKYIEDDGGYEDFFYNKPELVHDLLKGPTIQYSITYNPKRK